MSGEEALAPVVPLRRPSREHFACPHCGGVWFHALLVVNSRTGVTAVRSHVALCIGCKQEIELPG